MKLKIVNLMEFKADLLKAIVAEWESQIEILENQFTDKISRASDTTEPSAAFSKRELVEQEARIALSALKTPLAEVKQLSSIPAQTDDKISDFSLFDISVTELGKTKTTTYFALPLSSLEKQKKQMSFQGMSIVLTTRTDPFFGRSLNFNKKVKGGEAWEEPHMGHVIMTGRSTNDVRYQVSWVYQ